MSVDSCLSTSCRLYRRPLHRAASVAELCCIKCRVWRGTAQLAGSLRSGNMPVMQCNQAASDTTGGGACMFRAQLYATLSPVSRLVSTGIRLV